VGRGIFARCLSLPRFNISASERVTLKTRYRFGLPEVTLCFCGGSANAGLICSLHFFLIDRNHKIWVNEMSFPQRCQKFPGSKYLLRRDIAGTLSPRPHKFYTANGVTIGCVQNRPISTFRCKLNKYITSKDHELPIVYSIFHLHSIGMHINAILVHHRSIAFQFL